MGYTILKQTELFECISKNPPLTLILGSGFSYGIIPTTSEIVREDLPWWMRCQRKDENGPTPDDYHNRKEKDPAFASHSKAEAKAFWERVLVCHNRQPVDKKKPIVLNADGVPDNDSIGEAYRFALSAICTPGLSTPHDVRRYFGDTIRRARNRLNSAHLFLASIIAEKPRLFRTIFTTNFDPLLQRSLQLVNAPYFVSDRPETLQDPDDDDIADAVHVIHAHGSIYRYLLLNSPAEIEKFAAANQPKLQGYFRKHAVLIVGFSGWDDAITRALKNVDQFNYNLYWCDRNSDPEKSSLTDDAREVLKKHANAFYVHIKNADDLMVQLHLHLTGHTLPFIFREPILAAREQLDLCDLTGVKLPRRIESSATSADGKSVDSASVIDDFDIGNQVQSVRKRLDDAQDRFTGKSPADPDATLAAEVRSRFDIATDLYLSYKYVKALPDLDFVVTNFKLLDPAERALARFRRGVAYGERRQKGDVELAIADYTAVIAMPDAPLEQRVKSRINRGNVYGQSTQAKDVKLAITDYTSVINMLDAPSEQRAQAYINRGITYGKRGDLKLAMADYTAVIEMTDLVAELWAIAHLNRGFSYSQSMDVERAFADYTCVIDMPDATAELRAMAHLNRGFAYDKFGNVELAISDCTAVIEMPDANAEQRAGARINRGMAYVKRGQAGDVKLAVTDYTAVIDMPDAPVEQLANAYLNRGVAYSESRDAKDVTRAIDDYTAVINMTDAPAELQEKAHFNRDLLLKSKKLPPKKKK